MLFFLYFFAFGGRQIKFTPHNKSCNNDEPIMVSRVASLLLSFDADPLWSASFFYKSAATTKYKSLASFFSPHMVCFGVHCPNEVL